MKKLLMIFIIICLVIFSTFCLTACDDSDNFYGSENNDSFTIVSSEEIKGVWYTVVYHNETKIMYMVVHVGVSKGGLDVTPLFDEDGKLLVYTKN